MDGGGLALFEPQVLLIYPFRRFLLPILSISQNNNKAKIVGELAKEISEI
jgi:hypothetical protein